MKLYGYFRSSASYRARIALNLKQECLKLEALAAAHPERQPDAVKA